MREALAPARPDPSAFQRGVQARIRAREDEARDQIARLANAPEGMRWAASVVPPGFLPAALGSVGFGAKKLSLKAFPSLLALPAISSLMIVLTFVGALRSLRTRATRESSAGSNSDEILALWWKRNLGKASVVGALVLLLVVFRHPEAAMAIVLVSLAFAALLLAELARHGLAERARVGRFCAKLMGTIGAYGMFSNPLAAGTRSPRLGCFVLLVGAVLCLFASGILSWAKIRRFVANPIRMKYPDPITVRCLRALTWFGIVTASGVMVVYLGYAYSFYTPYSPKRARLLAAVEAFAEPASSSGTWSMLGPLAKALLDDGGPRPRLENARREIARALEQPDFDNSFTCGAAIRLGLVPREELHRWRTSYRGERLFEQDGAFIWGPFAREAEIRAALELGLDPAQRKHLVQRITQSWPAAEQHQALESMQAWSELSELLGDHVSVEARRSSVHDALRAAWRGSYAEDGPGSFAPNPEMASDVELQGISDTIVPSDAAPTLAAVLLMERYGVPDGIDIERLRASLKAEGKRPGRSSSLFKATLDLALLRLDALIPRPSATISERLLESRVILGAVLLVAFCVTATLRAPIGSERRPATDAG